MVWRILRDQISSHCLFIFRFLWLHPGAVGILVYKPDCCFGLCGVSAGASGFSCQMCVRLPRSGIDRVGSRRSQALKYCAGLPGSVIQTELIDLLLIGRLQHLDRRLVCTVIRMVFRVICLHDGSLRTGCLPDRSAGIGHRHDAAVIARLGYLRREDTSDIRSCKTVFPGAGARNLLSAAGRIRPVPTYGKILCIRRLNRCLQHFPVSGHAGKTHRFKKLFERPDIQRFRRRRCMTGIGFRHSGRNTVHRIRRKAGKDHLCVCSWFSPRGSAVDGIFRPVNHRQNHNRSKRSCHGWSRRGLLGGLVRTLQDRLRDR